MSINITDGTTIYQENVVDPYMVIDSGGVLYKIGEKVKMEDYYNSTVKVYKENGLIEEANSLVLIQLPHDQEEINKIFNIAGYVKRYIPKDMLGTYS